MDIAARTHEQECNTSPPWQDAFCLASSRICVQNLIQSGNSLGSANAVREFDRAVSCAAAGQVAGAASNSVVNAAFYGRLQ
jgi:hypothetical protein